MKHEFSIGDEAVWLPSARRKMALNVRVVGLTDKTVAVRVNVGHGWDTSKTYYLRGTCLVKRDVR